MSHVKPTSRPPLLTDWIGNQPEVSFPPHGGIPYASRLSNVAGYLNTQVHPHVEKGAIQRRDGFLNDHGPHHIETVVQRASWLLSHPDSTFPQLSAYEVYLLLLAIHFHDVGNIFGREGHETRHTEVMAQIKQHVGDEMVERQAILNIARAHGGKVNGNKDTISTLPPDDHILGHDIRYKTLAAILRFADELADDCHRAARMPQALGIIPKESEVFHAYSRSLTSVKVRPAEHIVDLRYSFTKENATRTFGKKTGKDTVSDVYLLDEIFDRTLKMHFERKYCMRFMQGVARIDAIDVRIDVYEDSNSMTPCTDPIGYRLQEQGYPDASSTQIRDLCPEVAIDGSTLEHQLTEEQQNDEA